MPTSPARPRAILLRRTTLAIMVVRLSSACGMAAPARYECDAMRRSGRPCQDIVRAGTGSGKL